MPKTVQERVNAHRARKREKADRGEPVKVAICVACDPELLAKLDARMEELRRTSPGPAWSRSDVVRLLLSVALGGAGA